jgi:ketosteroid isomerase-like protein
VFDDDKLLIDQIRSLLESAENACDADASNALLADDVVLMVPDYPVQEGKRAAAQFTCGVRRFRAWRRNP